MTDTNEKTPLIGIIGPTAVGKTAFSLRVAEELRAEVISVDSRQVYRYLDVGTDKVSAEERRRVPHHLLDVADPDQPFSAADFVSQTIDAVRRIRARGFVPLLVGGTPFYYAALANAMLTEGLPSDWELRRELEAEAQRSGREALHERLAALDPESAARLHPNDLRRVVRALEISILSGKPASVVLREGENRPSPFSIQYIGIDLPRQDLFARIDRRVRVQFESGFPEEVKWLLDRGYDEGLPALQGFGYKELVAMHKGQCSFEEALAGDVAATKAFARRQMTWFRKFPGVLWYDSRSAYEEPVFGCIMRTMQGHLLGEVQP